MQFKTEVNELLQLMIHSLYSNKEIFLRELISNASDACDKRSLARAKGEDESTAPLEIKISFDESAKLLIIEDFGCGMNAQELEENLGTIAHSGTKAFMLSQAEKGGAASELIGQFGVGFYSAFMVADKIEVYSKSIDGSLAHCWSSDASGYEITPCAKDEPGSKIVLHLKDSEYANELRIEHLVKKYSKHINYAICLEKAVLTEDGKPSGAKAFEQINSAKALWKENKSALKDADYEAFFADISYGAKPLGWVHTNSEGSLEYNSLFFIPSVAPRDLMQMDYEKGCKLYVKRVLISEKEDLLPIYLRFVKGVVDVADLDLNVSREILQDNAKLRKIAELGAKKVLGLIANFDEQKRKTFNEQFGAVLKEGLLDPSAAHEQIYKALDFSTSKGKMSLDEYVEKYAGDKKEIYFLQGENLAMLEQNALVNNFDCVVFLHDRVDEFISANLPDFGVYKWVNIAEHKIEAGCEGEEQTALAAGIKSELDAKVREVKFSDKLGDKLAAIVYDSEDQTYQISKMMAKFGGAEAKFVGDLILNSEHELIKKALAHKDEQANKYLANLLFASANLSNQTSQEDAAALASAAMYFAQRAYEA